ncbi:hypothetical protein [Tardiphaga sp. P5_C10]
MTSSTISVNGGALPRLDRGAIMRRAWAIFRQAYKYPSIKFASIGWKCFGACVRQAWAEAKEAARIAGIASEARAERIAVLVDAIAHEQFNDHWPSARANIAAIRVEISQLS